MSIEKAFVLYFPFKTKTFCTVKTAKCVSFLTFLAYFAYEFQYFIIYTSEIQDGVWKCILIHVPTGYKEISFQIESVLYALGPFTLMIIVNCAIIYKFMRAKFKSINNGTGSTNQALSKTATRGTAMLITVSLTFIILTGPRAAVLFIRENPQPIERVVLNIMQYLNHAINGILYCIVGSRFRREMFKVLSCCSKVTSIRNSDSGTTNPPTYSTTMTDLSTIDSSL